MSVALHGSGRLLGFSCYDVVCAWFTQEAFSGKPIDGPRVPIEGKGEKRLSANAELLDLPHLFLFETQ